MNTSEDLKKTEEENKLAGNVIGCIGLPFLLVAGLMFYFFYFLPNSRMAAAANWEEVPCKVLSVEFIEGDLDIVYQYEFNGQSYEGDRYHLAIGTSGEDTWAIEAYQRLSDDPNTTCFVNPDNPNESVIDREHNHPLALLVIPTIFGLVGLGLLYAAISTRRSTKPLPDNPKSIEDSPIKGLIFCSIGLALMVTFFIVMDGLAYLESWRYSNVEWVETKGEIVWGRESGVETMFGDVNEYKVRYTVDETDLESVCYVVGQPTDETKIEYDSDRPWRGRLVGSRLYATPPIFLMFPLGFGALILLIMLAVIRGIFTGGYARVGPEDDPDAA